MDLTPDGRLYGIPDAEQTATIVIAVWDADWVEQRMEASFRVSGTPSPLLESASFKPTRNRLTLTGFHLAGDALVEVNGRQLLPVRFVEQRTQLWIAGSAQDLGLRQSGRNFAVVTIGGQRSNVLVW
jgi:hypothetical protein